MGRNQSLLGRGGTQSSGRRRGREGEALSLGPQSVQQEASVFFLGGSMSTAAFDIASEAAGTGAPA